MSLFIQSTNICSVENPSLQSLSLNEESPELNFHPESNCLVHPNSDYMTPILSTLKKDEDLTLKEKLEFSYCLSLAIKSFNEDMIKEFHKILKTGTSDDRKSWFNVGEYKKLPNEVSGNETSKPENVSSDMKKLLEKYNSLEKATFEDIVKFHKNFETIHPFQDGNGRVGRIIMFKECLKNDIVPFIILDKDKMFYYRGLKEFDIEKGYLVDTCLNAQDQYQVLVDRFIK